MNSTWMVATSDSSAVPAQLHWPWPLSTQERTDMSVSLRARHVALLALRNVRLHVNGRVGPVPLERLGGAVAHLLGLLQEYRLIGEARRSERVHEERHTHTHTSTRTYIERHVVGRQEAAEDANGGFESADMPALR
jgi:hypothetical protein